LIVGFRVPMPRCYFETLGLKANFVFYVLSIILLDKEHTKNIRLIFNLLLFEANISYNVATVDVTFVSFSSFVPTEGRFLTPLLVPPVVFSS